MPTRVVAEDKTEFFTVQLFDTCAEDGDWVTIRLDNGLTFGPIPIFHHPTTVLVPINVDKPSRVWLEATREGGGGVTVALQTSTGVWFSRILVEGTRQEIPLTYR